MPALSNSLYCACRGLIRAGLWCYFSRIERFHGGNVPLQGPVLFASNHPNSLTDAFVIAATIRRKVNFVATVQLFRWKPLARILGGCGVIPVNRAADNPRGMRAVRQSFEACFRVLERGEAVGIFPEGITHDDPQLKGIKSGAARIALELEHRHEGKLGLRIVPVGLTFSAKDKYRSRVLVNFGTPLVVAEYLASFRENRHAAIQALSAQIQDSIRSVICHLPELERERIVDAVKHLYLDELWKSNRTLCEPVTPFAGELLLTQAIVRGIELTFAQNPARATEFVRKLDHYERGLKRLRLIDQAVTSGPVRAPDVGYALAWLAVAFIGAPIALYGWIHRLIPCAVVQWVVKRSAKEPADKTRVSTASIVSGMIVFTAFYGLCVFVFGQYFGPVATLTYALSLPLAGLVAHYCGQELHRLVLYWRRLPILLRGGSALRRLAAQRSELLSMITAGRQELLERQAL